MHGQFAHMQTTSLYPSSLQIGTHLSGFRRACSWIVSLLSAMRVGRRFRSSSPSRFPSNFCPGQYHLRPVKFAFGAGLTQAIPSGRHELAAAVLGIQGAKYPWHRRMYRPKHPREFLRTRGVAYPMLTASAHALVGLCPLGDDWPMA